MATPIEHKTITIDEYHHMIERGVLDEDDHVELIEGEIVSMPPIGPEHGGCVNALTRLFIRALGDRTVVAVQNSILLPNNSEPEPDISVLKPRDDMYRRSLPTPDAILLLIEVAYSSLDKDRYAKIPVYARAGISEVWLVNLAEEVIETYSDPANGRYEKAVRVGRGENISPVSIPDVAFSVDAILG
jgi:Uma2 family endonuclease